MTRAKNARPPGRRPAAADADLDEILLLAELRLAVEGARTAAEERLAEMHPGWRAGRVAARPGRV